MLHSRNTCTSMMVHHPALHCCATGSYDANDVDWIRWRWHADDGIDIRFSHEEANIKLWSNFLPRYRTIRLVTARYLSLICGGQLPRIFLKMTTIEETSPSGEVMMCRLDNEGVEERRVCRDVLYCFIDQQLLSGILLSGLSSASKTNVRRCFIGRDESRPKCTRLCH